MSQNNVVGHCEAATGVSPFYIPHSHCTRPFQTPNMRRQTLAHMCLRCKNTKFFSHEKKYSVAR